MGLPTVLVDDAAVTARALETTGANFDNGCNLAGSCAPGIGINMLKGAVVGTPEQFTLLDQYEAARDPQTSQAIGGLPYVDRSTVPWPGSGGVAGTLPDAAIRYGDNDAPTYAAVAADGELGGTLTLIANVDLLSLAAGWVAEVP